MGSSATARRRKHRALEGKPIVGIEPGAFGKPGGILLSQRKVACGPCPVPDPDTLQIGSPAEKQEVLSHQVPLTGIAITSARTRVQATS